MTKIQLKTLTLLLAIVFCLATRSARAAELAGIQMPNQMTVDEAQLTLNGLALRTVSLLHFRVYVVGLYLVRPSHDAQAIIESPQVKLLHFVFLRDVDAAKSRRSWQNSLARNCQAPCSVPPDEVAQFLSRVPAMSKGDIANVLFTPRGVDFAVNGRSLGWVTDPTFARVILTGFVGPRASPPGVREGILGLS
jgi:Chalcone isomerase-like